MNKKEIIIVVIVFFMCIGAILGIFCYNKLNRTSYCLNLPVIQELSKLTLKQNEKSIEINNVEEIKDIIDVLNGVKRVTKQESIQDYPINVDNEIKIDFELKESGTSTVFVYENNDKYFIEQAYNGIYRISPDEYNSIEKYIKN